MATLAFELLETGGREDWGRVAIEVCPGISALQAASARAGAPLGRGPRGEESRFRRRRRERKHIGAPNLLRVIGVLAFGSAKSALTPTLDAHPRHLPINYLLAPLRLPRVRRAAHN